MKKICLICIAVVIAGCAVDLRPSWIANSNRHLERFKNSFLMQGPGEATERHFEKTIGEIKKSGDLDLLEKAWLTRMAMETALLMEPDEAAYREIAEADPVPENENFYKFIKGNISSVDVSLLPEQYRGFGAALSRGDIIKAGTALASIKDEPVSRMIAAGVASRCNLEGETVIQTAIDTASANGWKAALITWLERMAVFYGSVGETERVAEIRRRIELIEK